MDLFVSDQPKLLVMPRGIVRTGEAGQNSIKWKSKYGSVVITAFNSAAVSDGFNEYGLAAHLLYLGTTKYPEPNKKQSVISNLLWAQYVLDNFKTVNEALVGVKDLQIVATKVHDKTWPIHFIVQDATGDAALIEYVEGKIQIFHGPQYQVVTNEPAYHIQLENIKRYIPFGGKLPLPGDPDPLSRFVRVAAFLKTLPKPLDDIEVTAGILSVIRTAMVPFGAVDVSGNKTEDAWATRWVTLADLTNKIYYFNSTTAPNIIWVDLKALNFAEGSSILTVDPTDIHLEGDIVNKLMPMKKI